MCRSTEKVCKEKSCMTSANRMKNRVRLCIVEHFKKRSPRGKADSCHAYVSMSEKNNSNSLQYSGSAPQQGDYILLTYFILTPTIVRVTLKTKVCLQGSVFDCD